MNGKYDASKLDQELKAAGLKIHGCSSAGRIDWISAPSKADLTKAQTILKEHSAAVKPSGKLKK